MPRFIESIKFENGQYHLLELHQRRVHQTFRKFFPLNIPFYLEAQLPKIDFDDKYKVRVLYNSSGADVEFAKYEPRNVESLKLVTTTGMDYTFKHEARGKIEKLYAQRGDADDVIIINNGLVTDSSYANLVFWDGNKWYTPRSYLLNGVKRQHYLKYGIIAEKDISIHNLKDFEKVSLINAMLELEEVVVSVNSIDGLTV